MKFLLSENAKGMRQRATPVVDWARISAKMLHFSSVCVRVRRTSSSPRSARRPPSTLHSGCSICFLFDGLLARKFVLHARKRSAGLSHVISQHIFTAFFLCRYHFADPERVKTERRKKKMNVRTNVDDNNTSRGVSRRVAASPSARRHLMRMNIFSRFFFDAFIATRLTRWKFDTFLLSDSVDLFGSFIIFIRV